MVSIWRLTAMLRLALDSITINDGLLGKISISPVPSAHVDNLPSYGYKICSETMSLYYSGDSNSINYDILKELMNGQLDRVYQDTCGDDMEAEYHLPLSRLKEIVDIRIKHKIYCMHLDVYFDTDEAEKLGFNVVSRIV